MQLMTTHKTIAAMGLAAWVVPGFTVASLGSAIVGALAVGLVSFLLNWLIDSFRT